MTHSTCLPGGSGPSAPWQRRMLHEVKPMRRLLTPPLAFLAGLVLLLSGCAGETPTAPSGPPGPTGPCDVTISLASTSVTPVEGSFVVLRATVKRNGVAVPDGTSVVFTTDFGFFLETGLNTVSKVSVGGFADVTLAALGAGASHVRATFDCATSAQLTIEFAAIPQQGPFVSSIFPNIGTCAGGDTVTINGGKFGTDLASTRVTFGGQPATIVSVTDNQIVVLTPARTLANPQVPETVDVVISLGVGTAGLQTVTVARGFTFQCIGARIFISSVVPSSGRQEGGETVVVNGGNFGTSIPTTRVTFCGVSATIVSMNDSSITVLTPRHINANPAVPEACDVAVTKDLGLVSQQSAVLPRGFTYRGIGPFQCDTNPSLFISSLSPNTGAPAGGDVISIRGGGFGTDLANTRVDFGGVPGQVTSVSPTEIIVSTPRRNLANPAVSEVVDVKVTTDVGGPNESCATLPRGFTYRGTGGGGIVCNINPQLFIANVNPNVGSPNGGETVTLNGQGFTLFGNTAANTRVEFGGVAGTVTAITPTSVTVTTPRRSLTNPNVSETVDVKLSIDVGGPNEACATLARAFTFRGAGGGGVVCNVNPSLFISSITPNIGSPDGGETVTVRGGGFGTNSATTRVEFGGVAGQITSVADNVITVTTPRRGLTNPNVSETVDIKVSRDVGTPTEACATLARAFTYRGTGPGNLVCNLNPALFISSITPNTGTPEGGDTVTLSGGGFGNTAATTRVEFGSIPAQIVSVSPNAIVVNTPRRNLADPFVPETVDVRVTIDVGGPNEACALLSNGFTYTRLALVPEIFSVSPRVGPNDSSTRVTIFGRNFQFPMQVLVTAAGCQGFIEASVVSVKFDQVVFLTPIALQGNNCLQGQLIDIRVINPVTGQAATCAGCFKYYDCPILNGSGQAFPAVAPYNQTTTVVVNGQNFEEPVQATFTAGGRTVPLNVTSVSSSGIALQMPPIDPAQLGSSNCGDVAGTINLHFLNLNCPDLGGIAFRYQVSPITVLTATPTQLNQNGSVFGTPTTSPATTITVTGTNFTDPATAVLINAAGAVVPDTTVNNVVIGPDGRSVTFVAPAVRDSALNQQACTIAGNLTGTRFVPTSFGIRITNTRTGCSATLPQTLIYNPNDTTCRSAPVITTTTLPDATLCADYGSQTISVEGGTGAKTFTVSCTAGTGAACLPTGLSLNQATGVISGTPRLPAPTSTNGTQAGTPAQPFTFTITVTDANNQSDTQDYTITLSDPGAPFAISGTGAQNFESVGGTGSTMTASPNTFTPITWGIDSITIVGGVNDGNPGPTAGSITLTSTSGPTTAINVTSDVPQGAYDVVLRATDTACNGTGFHHVAVTTVRVNKVSTSTTAVSITAPNTLNLPSGTLCAAYAPVAFTATGGTPPYTWSVVDPTTIPDGMFLDPFSGQLSGTPRLPLAASSTSDVNGGSKTFTLTVKVTDSSPTQQIATRVYNLGITDPNGPFLVTAPTNVTVKFGVGGTFGVSAAPTGWAPIDWSFVGTLPPASITYATTTGNSNTVSVSAATPVGNYDVTLRATDNPPCSPGAHVDTAKVTISVIP